MLRGDSRKRAYKSRQILAPFDGAEGEHEWCIRVTERWSRSSLVRIMRWRAEMHSSDSVRPEKVEHAGRRCC